MLPHSDGLIRAAQDNKWVSNPSPLCKICGKRRPKRACPAVDGDICSICCGTEREVSLTCPLTCQYLIEAHRRETPAELPVGQYDYPDVEVGESFLRDHEELLLFCTYSLVQAALRTPGAVDTDVIAALSASIETHRTLSSGLIYETRAANTIAADIQHKLEKSLEDYARERESDNPLRPLRNSETIAVLVFLYRVGLGRQNGRPRGRHYIDLLRQMTPDGSAPEAESPPSAIIL